MKKDQSKIKNQLKLRRVKRVRAKVFGLAKKPRLAVFRSAKHLAVQAIDDAHGRTLVSVYDREASAKGGSASGGKGKSRMEKARSLGKLLAEKLLEKKINTAVFDRRHYQYHGLVKELAEGAREGGLKF